MAGEISLLAGQNLYGQCFPSSGLQNVSPRRYFPKQAKWVCKILYTAFTSGTFSIHISILRALRSLAEKKPVYVLFIHGIRKIMGSGPIYEGIESPWKQNKMKRSVLTDFPLGERRKCHWEKTIRSFLQFKGLWWAVGGGWWEAYLKVITPPSKGCVPPLYWGGKFADSGAEAETLAPKALLHPPIFSIPQLLQLHAVTTTTLTTLLNNPGSHWSFPPCQALLKTLYVD